MKIDFRPLTWQSVLMCWAHVVCILASSGRSVSDVMSSRSCIEYLSEVSTKCCRSLSSRRNFIFMASVHTNRYFFMINSSSRSFYNIISLFNRNYVFSGFSHFYNFFLRNVCGLNSNKSFISQYNKDVQVAFSTLYIHGNTKLNKSVYIYYHNYNNSL